MTAPNFFILGAPRSATTFLYRALTQHPQVFMSTVKEPAFFSRDERHPQWVTPTGAKPVMSWKEYLALFTPSDDAPIRGEASTVYLADAHAAERIHTRLHGAPQMIAILRNPVDRAYSHYLYHRMLDVEPAPTFEDALRDESHRRERHWSLQWRYQETGLYGQHLEHYRRLFGRDHLLVLLHEDFSDMRAVFERICQFLNIDLSVPMHVEGKVNESGVSRNSVASWVLKSRNPVKNMARRLLPQSWRKRMRHQLTQQAPQMAAETRHQLQAFYDQDIRTTESLIGRDLSAWREP